MSLSLNITLFSRNISWWKTS